MEFGHALQLFGEILWPHTAGYGLFEQEMLDSDFTCNPEARSVCLL